MSGRPVEVVSPAPRDLWARSLTPESGALRSHTPEWLDLVCAAENGSDASRLYRWPSGRYVVLPMVRRRLGGLLHIEESLPPGWGFGGLVAERPLTADEAAAVYLDVTSRRMFYKSVCPNCLHGAAWEGVDAGDAVIVRRSAHVVDLAGGPGEVWKRFSSDARRRIGKAEHAGLGVECDLTGRLLGDFEGLWEHSVRQWAAQQKAPLWLSRLQRRRQNPQRQWRQVIAQTKDALAIWVARHRGAPIAALAILRGPNDHNIAAVMHKELATQHDANVLLHWLAIQDACRRGARWYQMGQSWSGAGDPVGRFKENFGARAYTFPELRWERVPLTRLERGMRRAMRRLTAASRRPRRGAARP